MNQETKEKKIKELEAKLEEIVEEWKDKDTVPGTIEHVQKKIARVRYMKIKKQIKIVQNFGWKPPNNFKKKANIAKIFGGVPQPLFPQEERNYALAMEHDSLVWRFENGKLKKLL